MNARGMFFIALAGALAVTLLAGCGGRVKVPKTRLDIETDRWRATLESEKDAKLDGLVVTIETNKTVSLTLTNFSATNSPLVIRETGKAQALTIKANGDLVDASGRLVGKVVDGVVTYFGSQ